MASTSPVTASSSARRLGHSVGGRLRGWWGTAQQTFGWTPLLIVIGLGIAVRLYALFAYVPSSLQWIDAIRFARISPSGAFGDVWAPAGYPAFLALLRQISNNLSFTIAVQHLLGLIGGLLIFAAVRRVAPRWVALVPAAVLIVGGDFLFLETMIMVEAYFTFTICVTLYAAIRALNDPHPLRWLAFASFAAGMSALVRSNALVIPPLIAVWALVVFAGPWRHRALRFVVALAPALILVVAYLVAANIDGRYSGLVDARNIDLYGRVAPFANCTKFTPPKGTERLCQDNIPRGQRPGSFWYTWVAESPGVKYYGLDPAKNGPLGKWARAAILGQPLDYAKIVAKDMFRYIDPTAGNDYGFSGLSADGWSFIYRVPAEEQFVGHALGKRYDGVLPAHMPGAQALDFYQTSTRLSGLFLALFSVVTIVGLFLARGRLWAVLALFAATAFLLYVGPVLTISYDVRYGLPPQGPLAAAAALSVWAILLRVRGSAPGEQELEATDGAAWGERPLDVAH